MPPPSYQIQLDSALRDAAQNGAIQALNHALREGANPQRDTPFQHNALQCAARNGHLECLARLLPLSDHIDDALRLASRNGHSECLALLLPHATHFNESLMFAAQNGHTDCVDLLLPRATQFNEALRLAILSGHPECISRLLPFSDPHYTSGPFNRTLLHWAVLSGHQDGIELLLPHSNPDKQDQAGWTVLHCAAHLGNLSLCHRLLLCNPALARKHTLDGNTPLHLAAQSGHIECLSLLLAHSDPLCVNHSGDTPLHLAAAGGYLECTLLLLPRSNGMALNAAQYTAKQVAERAWQTPCVTAIQTFLQAQSESQLLETATPPSSTRHPPKRLL